jgi:hypothetical protein
VTVAEDVVVSLSVPDRSLVNVGSAISFSRFFDDFS